MPCTPAEGEDETTMTWLPPMLTLGAPLEYHRKLRFHQGVKRPGELGLE